MTESYKPDQQCGVCGPPRSPPHETNRLEIEGSTPPAQRRCRRCAGGWGRTPFTPHPAVGAHTHCVAGGRGSPTSGRPTPRRIPAERAPPPPPPALPWLFHGWRAAHSSIYECAPPPGRGGLLGEGPPQADSSESQRGGAGMRWIRVIIHRPPMIDGRMVGSGRDLGCPDDAGTYVAIRWDRTERTAFACTPIPTYTRDILCPPRRGALRRHYSPRASMQRRMMRKQASPQPTHPPALFNSCITAERPCCHQGTWPCRRVRRDRPAAGASFFARLHDACWKVQKVKQRCDCYDIFTHTHGWSAVGRVAAAAAARRPRVHATLFPSPRHPPPCFRRARRGVCGGGPLLTTRLPLHTPQAASAGGGCYPLVGRCALQGRALRTRFPAARPSSPLFLQFGHQSLAVGGAQEAPV